MHALKAEVEHLKEHATYLARQVNEVSRERDSYKEQAHNLIEQRIACLREITELKAQVRTLREALTVARGALEQVYNVTTASTEYTNGNRAMMRLITSLCEIVEPMRHSAIDANPAATEVSE